MNSMHIALKQSKWLRPSRICDIWGIISSVAFERCVAISFAIDVPVTGSNPPEKISVGIFVLTGAK